VTVATITVVDLSGSAPPGIEIVAATHIGPVRTENQDVFAATAMLDAAAVGVLVADGMGGMPGGGEAAGAAGAEAVRRLATSAADSHGVDVAIHAANVAVAALRDASGGQPGTTLTIAAVFDGTAQIAHAGDSRAYLVRDGVATLLTEDHSWVGEQVRAGALPPGSERRHPRRNIITMAVMGAPIEPLLTSVSLRPGDLLALCSDGFWEPLDDDQIGALLSTPGPLPTGVERAVQAALDAGATDNVTLLVLRQLR
jgi:protein phosphatase